MNGPQVLADLSGEITGDLGDLSNSVKQRFPPNQCLRLQLLVWVKTLSIQKRQGVFMKWNMKVITHYHGIGTDTLIEYETIAPLLNNISCKAYRLALSSSASTKIVNVVNSPWLERS